MIEEIKQPHRNHCSISFIFEDEVAYFWGKKRGGKKEHFKRNMAGILVNLIKTAMPNQYNAKVQKYINNASAWTATFKKYR